MFDILLMIGSSVIASCLAGKDMTKRLKNASRDAYAVIVTQDRFLIMYFELSNMREEALTRSTHSRCTTRLLLVQRNIGLRTSIRMLRQMRFAFIRELAIVP